MAATSTGLWCVDGMINPVRMPKWRYASAAHQPIRSEIEYIFYAVLVYLFIQARKSLRNKIPLASDADKNGMRCVIATISCSRAERGDDVPSFCITKNSKFPICAHRERVHGIPIPFSVFESGITRCRCHCHWRWDGMRSALDSSIYQTHMNIWIARVRIALKSYKLDQNGTSRMRTLSFALTMFAHKTLCTRAVQLFQPQNS